MKEEKLIVKQVYDAKHDMQLADDFISQYLPFIKGEVTKFLNRPVDEAQDDELSIAMIAFHEAIKAYSKNRGAFLSFASVVMKNRLIDYYRSNKRHKQTISIDATQSSSEDGEDQTIEDTLTDGRNPQSDQLDRQATKEEIKELSQQMAEFDVSLSDVAENSPKQVRTLEACKKVLTYAKANREHIDYLLDRKHLPVKALVDGTGVPKKTIERHRKYLVALLLIYSNGYEMIRGHLSHMSKGGGSE